MILGLTGRNASGKGEIANFLQGKGFYYYSLSDVIREELSRDGLEVTRDNLVATGRRLRSDHGTGYLAEKILQRLEPDKNYVIDSFRHPDEVRVFRSRPNFRLLAVRADSETRFQRIRERGREQDPTTMEGFLALERAETQASRGEGQDLDGREAEADFQVENNGPINLL